MKKEERKIWPFRSETRFLLLLSRKRKSYLPPLTLSTPSLLKNSSINPLLNIVFRLPSLNDTFSKFLIYPPKNQFFKNSQLIIMMDLMESATSSLFSAPSQGTTPLIAISRIHSACQWGGTSWFAEVNSKVSTPAPASRLQPLLSRPGIASLNSCATKKTYPREKERGDAEV